MTSDANRVQKSTDDLSAAYESEGDLVDRLAKDGVYDLPAKAVRNAADCQVPVEIDPRYVQALLVLCEDLIQWSGLRGKVRLRKDPSEYEWGEALLRRYDMLRGADA